MHTEEANPTSNRPKTGGNQEQGIQTAIEQTNVPQEQDQPRRHLTRPTRQRLDLLLVARGLVESRERARSLILAGEVRVDGLQIDKAGTLVPETAQLDIAQPLPYVSRGGLKLAAALHDFALDVTGLTAVDVGASTGGFTDCLLQHGAAHIYAVDVGYGQLAWKIRNDPRVTPIERTNIRHLETLPDGHLADLAVIDASFISLALVLPATLRLLSPSAEIIALVKPQFEAGRTRVGKGGVVRNTEVHRDVLERTLALATGIGLHPSGITVSPAPGPAGNIEFLVRLSRIAPPQQLDIHTAIAHTLAKAQALARRPSQTDHPKPEMKPDIKPDKKR